MNPCKKIYFYTPAQTAAQAAGIVATFAAMLLLIVVC